MIVPISIGRLRSVKLTGQTAIVTGAGKGLGAAIARVLADEGVRLALCGRRLAPLETLVAELGPQHLALTCDVLDENQVEHTVGRVAEEFGQLDILVNNAGVAGWIPFEETTTEYFDTVIATNLRGSFLFCRHAWRHLKASKGQILNVSSIAGSNGYGKMTAYCASKWGLNGFSEALSVEGSAHGIRVMTLGPGAVDTDIWGDAATSEERERMMTPDQVAGLAVWLLTSPRNIQVKKTIIENFESPFEG